MIKYKTNLILGWMYLVLFLTQTIGFSQTLNKIPKSGPEKSLGAKVRDDVMHVVSSPFNMSKRDAVGLFIFGAITSGFVAYLDKQADEEMGLENHFSLQPAEKLANLGSIYDDITTKYFVAGLSSTMLTGGLIFKDKKLLQTTRLMMESFVLTQIITTLSKGILGRARPYTDNGPSDFNFFKFSGSEDFRSMPSGHTSAIFSMMTVIAKKYTQWWVKIPAYTLATSVALQRIESRNHWGADVIVGGALGYWVGSTLTTRQKKKPARFSIKPFIFPNKAGLAIGF